MVATRKLYPGALSQPEDWIENSNTGDLILGEKPVMTMPVSVFDSDTDATEEWLDRVSPSKRMILTTGFLCKIIFCHPLVGRW